MSKEMGISKPMGMSNGRGGHLYMQTNEVKNVIVHYRRGEDGKITEIERASTGGAGSGTFKPISGQESAPNAFEGAKASDLAVPLFPSTGFPVGSQSKSVSRPSSATAKLDTELSPPFVVNRNRRSGERITLPAPSKEFGALS